MSERLCSPVNGRVVMLEHVNDEMFAQKMLGDGVAVAPSENELFSPVDGVVTMVYETQHAIGIRSTENADILIHIGIDTVALKGKPFHTKVKVGEHVKKGDLLTVVDWRFIKKKGMDVIVPIIVMNRKVRQCAAEGNIQVQELLLEMEEQGS